MREGRHRARFALQESMFGGLPTVDGTRALTGGRALRSWGRQEAGWVDGPDY